VLALLARRHQPGLWPFVALLKEHFGVERMMWGTAVG
jgi:hypothetical protein